MDDANLDYQDVTLTTMELGCLSNLLKGWCEIGPYWKGLKVPGLLGAILVQTTVVIDRCQRLSTLVQRVKVAAEQRAREEDR